MTVTPISVTDMFDATHDNIAHLPKGQSAGYSTGLGGVMWTPSDWASHPAAVRISQRIALQDEDFTADVLDYEFGAATDADLVPWSKRALAHYAMGSRPGQRWPTLYASMSNITHVVNVLISGGITSGINLAVANFSLTRQMAVNMVSLAGGPFPVVWCQYTDAGLYDLGIVSVPWLKAVSVKGSPPPTPPPVRQPPPGQHHPTGDKQVIIVKVTAPEGQAWSGTRTFLYGGATLHHIVSGTDNAALNSVLDECEITWEQFMAIGGASVPLMP
jgi:hypothetical protein